MVGVVRSIQLIATLLVAGPVAVMGAIEIYAGHLVPGVVFLGLAVAVVTISEYVYTRLVGNTVGRVTGLLGVVGRWRGARDRPDDPER